eukprot:15448098-Alexandrium_andersonii.AAC.1
MKRPAAAEPSDPSDSEDSSGSDVPAPATPPPKKSKAASSEKAKEATTKDQALAELWAPDCDYPPVNPWEVVMGADCDTD